LDALNTLRAHWRFRRGCFGASACLSDGVRFPVDGLAIESVREVLRDLLLLLRLRRPISGIRFRKAVIIQGKEQAHGAECYGDDGEEPDQHVPATLCPVLPGEFFFLRF
jgi:hypothetical protein